MRQKIINLCNQISSAVCLAIFAKGYQLIIWWHSLLGLTCVGIWLEQLGQCEVSLLFRPRWSQNWDGHLETVCLSSVNYDLGRKPRYNIRARNAEDKHKWVVMVRKPYHENNGIYDLNLKKKKYWHICWFIDSTVLYCNSNFLIFVKINMICAWWNVLMALNRW